MLRGGGRGWGAVPSIAGGVAGGAWDAPGGSDRRDGVYAAGLYALQTGPWSLWRSWGLEAAAALGHSVGELGCAYADGCLTAEETVLAAYWRGRCVLDGNLPPGGMAAVGESLTLNCDWQ